MQILFTIVGLAGSVALLLWGIRMVQTGVQRAFGARLRVVLGRALSNRIAGFFAGLGVTAAMQSSTATGLMVTGFVAGGAVDLVPALGVMLGANVGTTLIVQALSFNAAEAAPALILVGYILFQRTTATGRDLGRVLIGLGLILMALHQFLALLTPFEHAPSLRMVLGAVSTEPVIAALLAAALTWLAHSSVAVVLVVMSFAAQGIVPVVAAFALVLGANLGTAINPLLEGPSGEDPAAKRLPLGNLLSRVLGVALALAFLPVIGPAVVEFVPENARAVANFHTGFNVVLALLVLPVLGPYAALLRRWLPERINETDPSRPLYLDPAAKDTPVVAIGGAAREALRMADVLEEMLGKFREALDRPDRRTIAQARRIEEILDRLNRAIKAYLVSLDPEALGDEDHQRIAIILTFVTNLEQAGDLIDRGLFGAAAKMLKRGMTFSPEDKAEIVELSEKLIVNVRRAANLFMTEDLRAARLLAAEKQAFRSIETRATTAHFDRLRTGRTESAQVSALHLDVLRELKAVNSHLVAAAAYPILERTSELLPNRIRGE